MKHSKFVIILAVYVLYVLFRRFPIWAFSAIQKEIPMTKEDLGYLVSAHSICFTFSKLIFGIATDRFSSIVLFLSGQAAVSGAILSLSYAESFLSVLIAVACIGAVQGCGWSPATRVIGQWYKGATYGTMFSILGCGPTIAGLSITMLKGVYWRTVAAIMGTASVALCAFCAYIFRNDSKRPSVEIKDREETSAFRTIVSSKVLWGIAFGHFLSLQSRTVCETWLPLFLSEQNISTSTYLVVYECSGIIATLASSVVLDRLCQVFPVDTARKGFAVASTLCMLITLMLSTSFPSYYMVFGALCGAFMNCSVNTWCLISSQAGLEHIAGSCSAFISFIATFGPIIGGSPLARLVSLYGYSVFLPFFAVEIALFLSIVSLRLPVRMTTRSKDD